MIERDTEENLLANTLNSLYDKNNGGFNTTAPSEGFVFGSESLTYKSTNNENNSEGDEVFNNSKAEKSFVISSSIKGASRNVEGQSAKWKTTSRIVYGDAEACNRASTTYRRSETGYGNPRVSTTTCHLTK